MTGRRAVGRWGDGRRDYRGRGEVGLFLMSKTLSNFDFGMFDFTSIFPVSPTFPLTI